MRLLLFFLMLSVQACGQSTSNNNTSIRGDDEAIMLKTFYTIYVTEFVKEKSDENQLILIKEKFVTQSLLKKLEKAELDYDPFLNAQDFDKVWLRSMSIQKISVKSNTYKTYKICFDCNSSKVCNELSVQKVGGAYRISDLVNLPPINIP